MAVLRNYTDVKICEMYLAPLGYTDDIWMKNAIWQWRDSDTQYLYFIVLQSDSKNIQTVTYKTVLHKPIFLFKCELDVSRPFEKYLMVNGLLRDEYLREVYIGMSKMCSDDPDDTMDDNMTFKLLTTDGAYDIFQNADYYLPRIKCIEARKLANAF